MKYFQQLRPELQASAVARRAALRLRYHRCRYGSSDHVCPASLDGSDRIGTDTIATVVLRWVRTAALPDTAPSWRKALAKARNAS